MKAFDSFRFWITPLSPLHIGTGESYQPTNYVIEDGTLYEFDTGSVMGALTAKDRERLLAIANSRPDTEMLKALQKFFFERRETLLPWAVHRIPVLHGVARFYGDRVGQTANLEESGKQVINRLEIDRTGFNPATCRPVLFGSSVKGAIRTALLDGENEGNRLQTVEDRRTGRVRKEYNLDFQQRLFQYRAGRFEQDPLRLIQLSDALWQGEESLPASEVFLAVNRKKVPVVDRGGRMRQSQAETKQLYQILECVSAWRYRAFAGQVNIQNVSGTPEENRRGDRQLPSAALQFGITEVARACNDFYRTVLDREMGVLRERGYIDSGWDDSLKKVLAAAREKMERGEAFLLRVGRHSGAEAVTVRGARDGNIRIMEGKDPTTGKQRFSYGDAAKTLWLAASESDQRSGLLPFGWCLVELAPLDGTEQKVEAIETACEPYLVAVRRWSTSLTERSVELGTLRAEAERKRQEEEALAREQAARAAAEAERLAAMSAEQQRIEHLRGQLERKRTGNVREQIGGALYGELQALVKEAASWTQQDKAALQLVGKEILVYIGAKDNKKAKELLRQLG